MALESVGSVANVSSSFSGVITSEWRVGSCGVEYESKFTSMLRGFGCTGFTMGISNRYLSVSTHLPFISSSTSERVGPASVAGTSARAKILVLVARLTSASTDSPVSGLVSVTLTASSASVFPNPVPVISMDTGIIFFAVAAEAASFLNLMFVTVGLTTFALAARFCTFAETTGDMNPTLRLRQIKQANSVRRPSGFPYLDSLLRTTRNSGRLMRRANFMATSCGKGGVATDSLKGGGDVASVS